jgi:succinyl-CoA synthetase beta subunit
MDIEEAARLHPESIVKLHIDPRFGVFPFQARKLGQQIGFRGDQIARFADILTKLYRIYDSLDAELVETNPFVVTQNGELILADARLNLVDEQCQPVRQTEQPHQDDADGGILACKVYQGYDDSGKGR